MALDIVVSACDDGSMIIHSLSKGKYTYSIYVEYNSGTLDNISEGELDNVAKPNRPRIEWVTIAANGNILSYCSDDWTLRCHNVNGLLLSSVEVTEKLYCFCLSEDRYFLLTGGNHKRVIVRSTITLQEISNRVDGKYPLLSPPIVDSKIPPFDSSIRSIAVSEDERHMFVGLANGELWILAPDGAYMKREL